MRSVGFDLDDPADEVIWPAPVATLGVCAIQRQCNSSGAGVRSRSQESGHLQNDERVLQSDVKIFLRLGCG